MDVHGYFEQFVGDTPYENPWRDTRIAQILEDAGLVSVYWQSVSGTGFDGDYRCDIISKRFTESEIVIKLKSIETRYGLKDINTFKPEWNKDVEAHAHFTVNLK